MFFSNALKKLTEKKFKFESKEIIEKKTFNLKSRSKNNKIAKLFLLLKTKLNEEALSEKEEAELAKKVSIISFLLNRPFISSTSKRATLTSLFDEKESLMLIREFFDTTPK